MFKAIRWQQRFVNFERAYLELKDAVALPKYSKLERGGLIQVFEFTFELSWKTLKDYLESQGVIALSPREIFKEAFSLGLLQDVEVWLDALEKRNILSHTYDEEIAYLSEGLIKNKYFSSITTLYESLKAKIAEPIFGIDLKTLNHILGALLAYPQLAQAKVFGSRAMGNAKLHSDIDLCLYGALSLDDAAKIKAGLESSIPYSCDIVVYDLLSPELKAHVDQFGKALYL